MKKNYNSKQIKIYEEYNSYSSEMLAGMVSDRKNYSSEVIGIIKDIIAERNRGFYTPEPEIPDNLTDNQNKDAEPVYDGETIYEEVPWLTKNEVYIPGISGYEGVAPSLAEDNYEEEEIDEDEIDIEAEKQKYWKCPSCNELVEIEYDVCWKCQAEKPGSVSHPGKEEVIKEITENSGRVKTFGTGLLLLGLGGVIFLFDRSRYYHFDDFFHNDIFRYFFSALFGLLGLYFIIIHFFNSRDKKE